MITHENSVTGFVVYSNNTLSHLYGHFPLKNVESIKSFQSMKNDSKNDMYDNDVSLFVFRSANIGSAFHHEIIIHQYNFTFTHKLHKLKNSSSISKLIFQNHYGHRQESFRCKIEKTKSF